MNKELDELKSHFNKALNGVSKDIKSHINKSKDTLEVSSTPLTVSLDYEASLVGMIRQVIQGNAAYANMTIEQIQEQVSERLRRDATITSAMLSIRQWLKESPMSADEIEAWVSSVGAREGA